MLPSHSYLGFLSRHDKLLDFLSSGKVLTYCQNYHSNMSKILKTIVHLHCLLQDVLLVGRFFTSAIFIAHKHVCLYDTLGSLLLLVIPFRNR